MNNVSKKFWIPYTSISLVYPTNSRYRTFFCNRLFRILTLSVREFALFLNFASTTKDFQAHPTSKKEQTNAILEVLKQQVLHLQYSNFPLIELIIFSSAYLYFAKEASELSTDSY